MSRIWDELREAERERAARGIPKADRGQGKRSADRRRSKRSVLSVAVAVYGHAKDDGEPFYEETHTLDVNASGGLLTLAAGVTLGQKLLLTNMVTEEEQECRVVEVRAKCRGQTEVGIEFPRHAPHFWRTDASDGRPR